MSKTAEGRGNVGILLYSHRGKGIVKRRGGESQAGIGEKLFACRFFTWRWDALACYLSKEQELFYAGRKCGTKAGVARYLKPHEAWLSEFIGYKCVEKYVESLVPLINLKSYYKWVRQEQPTACFILFCSKSQDVPEQVQSLQDFQAERVVRSNTARGVTPTSDPGSWLHYYMRDPEVMSVVRVHFSSNIHDSLPIHLFPNLVRLLLMLMNYMFYFLLRDFLEHTFNGYSRLFCFPLF